MTQVKFLGAYTIPKINIQASATFQSSPGPLVQALYNAPSAVVQPTLGRPLSGGATNVTVNLVPPGTMYGDRLNQVDFRVTKSVRLNRTNIRAMVDLYNLFNTDHTTGYIETFDWATSGATWLRPNAIVAPRFVRFNVTVNF